MIVVETGTWQYYTCEGEIQRDTQTTHRMKLIFIFVFHFTVIFVRLGKGKKMFKSGSFTLNWMLANRLFKPICKYANIATLQVDIYLFAMLQYLHKSGKGSLQNQ